MFVVGHHYHRYHRCVVLPFLVSVALFSQAFAMEEGSILDNKSRLVLPVLAVLAAALPAELTEFDDENDNQL